MADSSQCPDGSVCVDMCACMFLLAEFIQGEVMWQTSFILDSDEAFIFIWHVDRCNNIWNTITGSHYFRYLNTYFIPCRLKNTAFIVFVARVYNYLAKTVAFHRSVVN